MRWKEILTESVKKYEPMFAPFRDENGKMPDWVAARISSIEKLMKREDRVVWALRWERFAALQKNTNVQGDPEQVKRKIIKDLQTDESDLGPQLSVYERLVRDYFAHYLSLPIHGLQTLVFARQTPEEVSDAFENLEAAWQKEAVQKLHHEKDYPETGEEEEETDFDEEMRDCDSLPSGWQREDCREKVERERAEAQLNRQGKIEKIIDFGDGWAWWDLNRAGCGIEGKAMGHCGNVPSAVAGDTVLSLRKDIGNGYFRPSLTFILHGNGYLGEMKGRANEKPNEKYWPYIIRLLNDDRIEGVEGGGYASDNNFSVLDLPEEQRAELLAQKPSLMSIHDRLKDYANNPSEDAKTPIIREVKRRLNSFGFGFSHIDFSKPERPLIIIDEWKDREHYINNEGRYGPLDEMQDFFEDLGDNLAQYCDDYTESDIYSNAAYRDYFNEMFNSLSHYSHDEFCLDGMSIWVIDSVVKKGVSVKDFLNPSSSWMDYDDDHRSVLERIDSLDETCSEQSDWTDIKDSFNDLDEIGQLIAQLSFGKDKDQATGDAAYLIYQKYSGAVDKTTGSRFEPHPDQLKFPYYSRPGDFGAKMGRNDD